MRKISKNTLLNFIILSIFTIIFLVKQNYEFIIYAVTIGLLIYVIEKTNKRFGYSRIAKYGFSLWLLVHFLGGLIYVNGIRLYDLVLIPILGEPFNILKYDLADKFILFIACFKIVSASTQI